VGRLSLVPFDFFESKGAARKVDGGNLRWGFGGCRDFSLKNFSLSTLPLAPGP
jgi:hypothetical protein